MINDCLSGKIDYIITKSVSRFERNTVDCLDYVRIGYKKGTDGEPEIVPSEAKAVQRIYELYLSGQTSRQIADQIKAEGYSFPEKNITFCPRTIQNILTNEKYSGDAILQKTYIVDCIAKNRKKNNGEVPMYIVQNNHPAIIDRDTFNRVKAELIRRKVKMFLLKWAKIPLKFLYIS